jgi:hypothetical protein
MAEYGLKAKRMKFALWSVGVVALSGCQSTTEIVQQEPKVLNVPTIVPQLPKTTIEAEAFEDFAPHPTKVDLKADDFTSTVVPPNAPVNMSKHPKNDSPLLNKQVCKDNIEVTYYVTDSDGVRGSFPAKVQGQGLIVALSHDQKKFKIKTTGWYTQNDNLLRWMPYLRSPPIARGIMLKVGAEFWDLKQAWYQCDLTPIQ